MTSLDLVFGGRSDSRNSLTVPVLFGVPGSFAYLHRAGTVGAT